MIVILPIIEPTLSTAPPRNVEGGQHLPHAWSQCPPYATVRLEAVIEYSLTIRKGSNGSAALPKYTRVAMGQQHSQTLHSRLWCPLPGALQTLSDTPHCFIACRTAVDLSPRLVAIHTVVTTCVIPPKLPPVSNNLVHYSDQPTTLQRVSVIHASWAYLFLSFFVAQTAGPGPPFPTPFTPAGQEKCAPWGSHCAGATPLLD